MALSTAAGVSQSTAQFATYSINPTRTATTAIPTQPFNRGVGYSVGASGSADLPFATQLPSGQNVSYKWMVTIQDEDQETGNPLYYFGAKADASDNGEVNTTSLFPDSLCTFAFMPTLDLLADGQSDEGQCEEALADECLADFQSFAAQIQQATDLDKFRVQGNGDFMSSVPAGTLWPVQRCMQIGQHLNNTINSGACGQFFDEFPSNITTSLDGRPVINYGKFIGGATYSNVVDGNPSQGCPSESGYCSNGFVAGEQAYTTPLEPNWVFSSGGGFPISVQDLLPAKIQPPWYNIAYRFMLPILTVYSSSGNLSSQGLGAFTNCLRVTSADKADNIAPVLSDIVNVTSSDSASSGESGSANSGMGADASNNIDGLTTAQQAGIGVGVSVFCIALLSVLAFLIIRRRKRRESLSSGADQTQEGDNGKAMLDGNPIFLAEMGLSSRNGSITKVRMHELPGCPGSYQLDGREMAQLPGDDGPAQVEGDDQSPQLAGDEMPPQVAGDERFYTVNEMEEQRRRQTKYT